MGGHLRTEDRIQEWLVHTWEGLRKALQELTGLSIKDPKVGFNTEGWEPLQGVRATAMLQRQREESAGFQVKHTQA